MTDLEKINDYTSKFNELMSQMAIIKQSYDDLSDKAHWYSVRIQGIRRRMSNEERERLAVIEAAKSKGSYKPNNPILIHPPKHRRIPSMKAVQCVNTGETWATIYDCIDHLGARRSTLDSIIVHGRTYRNRRYIYIEHDKYDEMYARSKNRHR